MGGLAVVSFRRRSGAVVEDHAWSTVAVESLKSAVPWRTFRWYKGQKHYSGTYWSSTVGDHVIYESRLELARLLFADFDPLVQHIVAQPFLLKAEVDGKVRRHIPDFLLIARQGPLVVDVKPPHRLSRPEVASTFEWTRQVVESRGWQYQVWSEARESELDNVRFLSGYRRDWLFPRELLDDLREAELDGVTLGEAVGRIPRRSWPIVQAAIYHLLWTGELVTDLDQPLSSLQVVRRAA